jgi:hypothetical protein
VSGGPEETVAAEGVLGLLDDVAAAGLAFFLGRLFRDIILADWTKAE